MGKLVLNQRLFYISNLVCNGLILSFYAVMAFTPHYPCLTASGSNITKGFEFAFKAGFALHFADFCNSGFFDFFIRQKISGDMENYG